MEGRPCYRLEPPAVTKRAQGQYQDTKCSVVPDDTVRLNLLEPVVALAAGPDDKFAQARRVGVAERVLWGETFVIMLVSVEHYVGMGSKQVPPEGAVGRFVAMLAGAESRLMPVRECARGRMLPQICREPPLLRGSAETAANEGAISVQRDQMPGSQVEAVVAAGRHACGRAKIVVVASSISAYVLMIARHRM